MVNPSVPLGGKRMTIFMRRKERNSLTADAGISLLHCVLLHIFCMLLHGCAQGDNTCAPQADATRSQQKPAEGRQESVPYTNVGFKTRSLHLLRTRPSFSVLPCSHGWVCCMLCAVCCVHHHHIIVQSAWVPVVVLIFFVTSETMMMTSSSSWSRKIDNYIIILGTCARAFQYSLA